MKIITVLSSLKKPAKLCLFLSNILFTIFSFAHVENVLSVENRIEPVTFFVGREGYLKEISNNLSSYKIASLIGVTGIGKTEIARYYSFAHKAKYNLTWFFDVSLDLNEQFSLLAKRINQIVLLESDKKISETNEKSKKEVLEFLTDRNDWLLVFDNLKLKENARLLGIINWAHNGHILICSQDAAELPHNIYIHKLDPENSLLLLKKILSTKSINNNMLKSLLDIFKGYPELIVQGANLLRENTYLSVYEYKNILSKSINPIKTHMELILNSLNDKDTQLLYTIAMLNNPRFSKNLLKIIASNPDSVAESLYDLNRFGLIKNIENTDNLAIFEMHDLIKDSSLQFLSQDQIKGKIAQIIDKLNPLMSSKGVSNRYAFITSDQTIKSSLEVLLSNAEKYNVDVLKILELRKNLINYYMASLDYYNIDKMKQWLEEAEKQGRLFSDKMQDDQKINYAWYLTDIGIYEHFAKDNNFNALAYFSKAQKLISQIDNIPELRSTILFQIAQAQIYAGNIVVAEESVNETDFIINKYPNADFDMGLYWFLKARIALAKGQYNDALIAINKNIEAEIHLPRDTFTAPTYIVKAEILNYMGDYKSSYDIIKEVEKQELSNNGSEHEIHARILVQLSRAELGLGLTNDALEHSVVACDIFQKEVGRYVITSVTNPEYAAALVAKSDALFKKGEIDKALEGYNQAEVIYFRKYGDNYQNMDDVSYFLSQGSKAACIGKKLFWKTHFYDQLITRFPAHRRTLEVVNFCKKWE